MSTYISVVDGVDIRSCDCECHIVGNKHRVMHCVPCCDLCGDEYLNVDGSLNQSMFDKAAQKCADHANRQKRASGHD